MHIGKELKERKLSEQATKGKELIHDVHKVSLCPVARGGTADYFSQLLLRNLQMPPQL